jgi:1,4-alpha-glucan branching enzyme
VFVRFELVAPGARTVSVAGSFNGWRVDALPMVRGAAGLWSVTVPLPVGEHRYEFVVDQTRWVPDPTAHSQVDDGFGGRNSVIVVGPKGLVRS